MVNVIMPSVFSDEFKSELSPEPVALRQGANMFIFIMFKMMVFPKKDIFRL